MNFPGLGPALWKLAITKSFEGIVLLLPLSILLYRAPCLIPHAGNREVTEEADGHEVDCRVLLWDKDRSMIVTIDNRELRWFADCRTSAMLVLVFSANDFNLVSQASRPQRTAVISGHPKLKHLSTCQCTPPSLPPHKNRDILSGAQKPTRFLGDWVRKRVDERRLLHLLRRLPHPLHVLRVEQRKVIAIFPPFITLCQQPSAVFQARRCVCEVPCHRHAGTHYPQRYYRKSYLIRRIQVQLQVPSMQLQVACHCNSRTPNPNRT